MNFKNLQTEERSSGVLLVSINRPEVRNAVNTATGEELLALWETLHRNPDRYRCVILTGSGQEAFCAGGDLKERNGMSEETWQAQHYMIERMVRAHMTCPVPSIAAVNGVAFAGGFEMALACDFIYASTTARFALTETRLGIIPGAGGTQNLARAVGLRRAKELILGATPFSAQEAYEWGVANKLCAPDALLEEAVASASRIAANAPLAVRQARSAMNNGVQMDISSALMFEIEAYHRLVGTQDRAEGVRAFIEKRTPNFVGR